MEICGWQVESALPLPELPAVRGPLSPQPDLVVDFGAVPDRLPDPVFDGPILQVAQDGTCRIGIARGPAFLVDPSGSQVTIATDLPPESPVIRAFLLGNVFAIICLRRGVVPVHACCIRVPSANGDVAIAFAASSGSGKSTLASAFVRRGYHVLADDLTALSQRPDGEVWALPSFPRVRLWPDTMERFQYPVAACERVREGMEKYAVPLTEGFGRTPLRLAAVYHFSRVEDERHAGLRPLQGLHATARFMQAVYQHRILARAAAHDRPAHISRATRMAGGIPQHWSLAQPSGLGRLDGLIDRLVGLHGARAPG